MASNQSIPPLNGVVLSGTLAAEPEHRQLPSGSHVCALQLTVPRPGTRADTVPVSLFDPPATVADLRKGQAVVVIGRVRRRFYRGDGGTRSRTDVVADTVVPATHRRRVAAAVDRHRRALDELAPT